MGLHNPHNPRPAQWHSGPPIMLGWLGVLAIATVACSGPSAKSPTGAETRSASPSASVSPAASPAATSTPSSSASPTSGATPSTIAQAIVGEWQEEADMPSMPILLFTTDGKAYKMIPAPASTPASESEKVGSNIATEVAYTLNPTSQPAQIDLMFPGMTKPMPGIVELTADGKLRMDLNDPRPSNFSDKSTLFKRISTQAKLPANTRILNEGSIAATMRRDAAPANNMAQITSSEGKQMVGALSRNQKAFFTEKNKFAATMDDLGMGIPLESENYSYKIVGQANQQVAIAAQAKKPELHSYLAVVIAAPSATPTTVICETEQPSTTPPSFAGAGGSQFQCPGGSRSARD